ncbi:MAG: hypothetical protein AB7I44_21185 [Hyphomicrobiaceae bacterium]
MTDNWQLEDKVNELVARINSLTKVVTELLFSIEHNKKPLGMQGDINTVRAKMELVAQEIRELDLSPRPTKPYRPRIITRDEEETG